MINYDSVVETTDLTGSRAWAMDTTWGVDRMMMLNKNRLQLQASFGTTVLAILVFALQHGLHFFSQAMGMAAPQQPLSSVLILMALPVIGSALGMILYRQSTRHPYLPVVNVVTLTLGSIACIAGSGGFVEFHFSIFMVVAIAAFYESVSLILLMTVLFAIQHVAGFFLAPELVFGSASYSFTMVAVHAGFLILTSGVTIWFITQNKQETSALRAERDEKDEELRTLIQHISSATEQVASTADQLASNAEENGRSTEHVSSSIQEIAVGAEEQSRAVSSIEQTIAKMAAAVQHIAESSSNAQHAVAETLTYTESGNRVVKDAFTQMHDIETSIRVLSEEAVELGRHSGDIGGIVELISRIAGQTNLLALNASIEAARAGEHGKGFAVVAQEVRNLAEQSMDAVRQITTRIEQIQVRIKQTVAATREGQASVASGVTKLEETNALFQTIKDTVGALTSKMHDVSAASGHLGVHCGDIVGAIGRIVGTTDNAVAATEELSGASQQQLASTQEISASAVSLAALAAGLRKTVSALGV